jgi:hypothetical protein
MKAFISYTREKDKFEEIVSVFRARLENEMQLRDREATVFQDANEISAGQRFPIEITKNIADSDVLVVLLSPAWLQSEWCRKEFDTFVTKEISEGREPRILPLLWVDVSLASDSEDPIARQLYPIQNRDWRDLRKKDWKSEDLKNELDALAARICTLATSSTAP